MQRVTRSVATNKNQPEEPAQHVLKIKLSTKQVQTAVQLAQVQKRKTAVEEAATIEAKLRQAKETELQEALQVTRPMAPKDIPVTDKLPELTANDGVDECDQSSDVEGESVDGLKEGTPLVFQSSDFMRPS